MPLVFVHGVGNRPGADYNTALQDRTDLAERFIFKRLGYSGKCIDALWGDVAATPAWHWASLPGAGVESFGEDDSFVSVLASQAGVINAAAQEATLLLVARDSLEDAIDILWAACADSVDEAEVPDLLEVVDDLLSYAESNPQPEWLSEVQDDDEFLERLEQEVETTALRPGAASGGIETFGIRQRLANAWARLGEGVDRTRTVTARVSGAALVKVSRQRLNSGLGLFLGDIFVYLDARGYRGEPGPIVQRVAAAFKKASDARTPEDPHLFVLAHSLGGVISYDVLSYFQPDIDVDVLVTVGSQVALFEELKRFRISDPAIPGEGMPRVLMPRSIRAWVNIMDYNDVLGFATEAVFDGPRDFIYSTGKGALAAHGSYLRPSFFRKLGKRLAEITNAAS